MKNLPHTPVQTFAPQLIQTAQGIRAVFFDVDGILTRGELLYTDASARLVTDRHGHGHRRGRHQPSR